MDLSNPLLVWGSVALIGGLTFLWMLHTFIIRPRRNSFEDEGVVFELAPNEGLVHISTPHDVNATSLKFGCGAFQFDRQTVTETHQKWFKGSSGNISTYTSDTGFTFGSVSAPTEGRYIDVTTTRETGNSRVILHELDPIDHYHRKWATHPNTDRASHARLVADFTLSNGAARALQRWVNAHSKQLTPSEGDIRMAWEKTCKQLLGQCRKDQSVRPLKKPVEVYDFDTQPRIRYLAIGRDGEVRLRTTENDTVHHIDFDDLQGHGMKLTVPLVPGRQETFTLSGEQVAALHHIRRRWQKRQVR